MAAVSLLAPQVSAARGRPGPVITVSAGGDRTGDTSVAGLDGVRFDFYAGVRGIPPGAGRTPSASCLTGEDGVAGRCSVDVPARSGGSGPSQAGYWIVQAAVPAGWFADPVLDTGSATSIVSTGYSRLFVGSVTGNISVPVATMTSTATATARGGAWATSRDNPPFPEKCGLRVALLFDLSGSIGANITQLRSAGINFVDALTGTPSSVGVYTFAASAPANTANNSNMELTPVSTAESAARVKAKINGLTPAAGAAANWDRGIWQIAADATHYDVAVVLTDGNPTVYGPTAQGPGSYTRLIEVENGIFSANALKARDTTVLSVGIGSAGIGSVGASRADLAAISGPAEGTDYFATSFAGLSDLLTRLARENCQGTVNVVKQVVPASSPGDLAAASPAPGWRFAAAPDTVEPQSGLTDASGAISFATKTASSQPVTMTETEQAGYHLITQDGKNAACRNPAGQSVPVTNAASGPGFTVDAVADQAITCEVVSQEPKVPDPASVVVDKTWDINGVSVPDGDQDPDFQARLTLDPIHPPGTEAVWGSEYHGYLAGGEVTVAEQVTLPPGCTLDSSGDLGQHLLLAGLNTFTVINTVTCDTLLTLVKHVVNDHGGTARAEDWTLAATPDEAAVPPAPRLSGVTGTPAVTGVEIPPWVPYTLHETGPGGYALSSLDCAESGPGTPVPLRAGDVLTATIDQHVTCTFTSTQQAPVPRSTTTTPVPRATATARAAEPAASARPPAASARRPAASARPPAAWAAGFPVPRGGAAADGGPPGLVTLELLAGGVSAGIAGAAILITGGLRRRRGGLSGR